MGPRFTWCNNHTGGQECESELIEPLLILAGSLFPHHLVHHLPKIASDHYPLLLSTAPSSPVIPPSDLRNSSFTIPDLKRLSGRFGGYRPVMMRGIASPIDWNWLKGDSVSETGRRLGTSSSGRILLNTPFPLFRTRTQRMVCLMMLWLPFAITLLCITSLLTQQETFWRHKARIQWLKEGDRNAHFFHHATMVHHTQN